MLLVIVYPVLILVTLAMIFSVPLFSEQHILSGQKIHMAIFLPQNTPAFDSQSFFNEIQKHEQIYFHLVKPGASPGLFGKLVTDPEEKVKQAIQLGVARVGIVIEPPKDKTSPIKAKVLFDNSSLLASNIIVLDAKFALEFLSGEHSRKILTEIWNDLGDIDSKLRGEASKIDGFISELDVAENKLVDLRQKINSIDIAAMKSELASFDYYYLDSRQKISAGISDAQQTKSQTIDYRLKLLNARSELSFYHNVFSSVAQSIAVARNASSEPVKSQLDSAYNSLSQQVQRLSQTISEIDQAILDIDNAQVKLDSVISQLNQADGLLVQTNAAVTGFRQTVDTLDNTIREVNELLDQAIDAKKVTAENLVLTKNLLDGLIKNLGDLRGFDPSFLTQPVEISSQQIYPVNDLAVMTPIGISFVILLTSLLLTGMSVIFDREQGASFRVSVSPTSRLEWLGGKVIGQLLFALFETFIIIVLAVVLFGVPVQGNIFELVLAVIIVSLTFITAGLFIANFTKTQSTTILAGLLLIVPMVFLSGIVFPHEFMPEFAALIGKILPLTQSIEIISTVMVRGLSLVSVGLGVLFMLFLSTVFFVASVLNPTYLK